MNKKSLGDSFFFAAAVYAVDTAAVTGFIVFIWLRSLITVKCEVHLQLYHIQSIANIIIIIIFLYIFVSARITNTKDK